LDPPDCHDPVLLVETNEGCVIVCGNITRRSRNCQGGWKARSGLSQEELIFPSRVSTFQKVAHRQTILEVRYAGGFHAAKTFG
jgi:hypothetical protein